MAGTKFTAEEIRSVLDYDPATGLFTWKKTMTPVATAGKIAGCKTHKGYWQIRLGGKNLQAHRIAWLHYYGAYPANNIDHVNGDKCDNRIENLRDVTTSINAQNYKRASSRNKSSGLLGVYKEHWNYRARITINGKLLNLGSFRDKNEAYAAYIRAKRMYHEGNTL